jgi:hypothetical protein
VQRLCATDELAQRLALLGLTAGYHLLGFPLVNAVCGIRSAGGYRENA